MPRTAEESPLLGGEDSRAQGFIRHHIAQLKTNVSKDYADIILLLLTFHTGITDGAAISQWNAFVSMQTGNTIYLGLGIAEPSKNNRWQKALVSILCFMFGSMLFGHFHRIQSGSPTRRWILVTSFIIQTLCIVGAAIMVTMGIIDGETMNWPNVLSIALLSIQSSGQAVASQALQYAELPTVVLTSVYRDLMSDPSMFAKPSANPKRNRRAIAIVLCCGGAAAAKLLSDSAVGLAGALWVSAGIKAFVSVVWMFWSPEEEREE